MGKKIINSFIAKELPIDTKKDVGRCLIPLGQTKVCPLGAIKWLCR